LTRPKEMAPVQIERGMRRETTPVAGEFNR
jgi:hypothetical protein